MAKVVTESFRVESTNEFVSSFEDSTKNDYYIMGSSSTTDATITNNQKDIREFQRRVVFGNKITPVNVKYMFKMNPWTSGVIYDAFDDTKDMSNKNFYVTLLDGPIGETSYKVFKCISNNNGATSTQGPSTALAQNIFETTTEDGYIWKYMFDVPPSDYIQFATSEFLPFVQNTFVEQNAQQGLSDILVESSELGVFNAYVVGTGIDESVSGSGPSSGLINSVIELVAGQKYQVELVCDKQVKSTPNEYTNMYFRVPDQGDIYEVTGSEPPVNALATNKTIFLTVEKLQNEQPVSSNLDASFIGLLGQVVPKVRVSNPNKSAGQRAIAYGVINSTGDLIGVDFKTKGTHYDYATATVQQPGQPEGTDVEGVVIRVVHSPTGGHGSHPVHELYMSRVETVTTFFTDVTTNIPDSNTYTKVGVVKNPQFTKSSTSSIVAGEKYRITNIGTGDQQNTWNTIAGTANVVYSVGSTFKAVTLGDVTGGEVMILPSSFDNRVKLQFTSVLTDTDVQVGYYVSQTDADGETCSGIVHEVELLSSQGDSAVDTTKLHIVDFSGAYNKQFTPSSTNLEIRETPTSASTTYSNPINSVTYNPYQTYTGELLHFVDFDPITRTPESKEKVKLIFDF